MKLLKSKLFIIYIVLTLFYIAGNGLMFKNLNNEVSEYKTYRLYSKEANSNDTKTFSKYIKKSQEKAVILNEHIKTSRKIFSISTLAFLIMSLGLLIKNITRRILKRKNKEKTT